MAKNTVAGSRSGAVTGRTQVKDPATSAFVERDENDSATDQGKFMAVKKDCSKFKGVAVETDGRRKKA